MRVVETGNHRALVKVDELGGTTALGHGLGIAADRGEAPVLDRHRRGAALIAVDGVDTAVEQDQICRHGTP
ncbi:hypothetical protein D9M71_607470 [compost metagenome]